MAFDGHALRAPQGTQLCRQDFTDYNSEDFRFFNTQGSLYRYAARSPASPFFFLDPTRQAQDISEMEQSHLSDCCWYAWAKMRLSEHDWSLWTTLLKVWPAAPNIVHRSSVLPLPQMWLAGANKVSPGLQIKVKPDKPKTIA